MRFKIVFIVLLVTLSLFIFSASILFDAGHGQDVGNADWTINGAYSDFAQSLRRFFNVQETYRPLTYSLLEKYAALVIPEPNDPFSYDEEMAILKYIKNGGGVFFIADHEGADRNNNGWDAVSIYDDFVKKLGFEFEHDTRSQYPVKYVLKSPITIGVKDVGEWAGSTLKIFSKDVHPAVELYTHQIYVLYGKYGKGRFVAIGDSSPFDDGTGARWKSLYDGWHTGDDAVLGTNAVYWLATGEATDTSVYLHSPVVKDVKVLSPYTVEVIFDKKILSPVLIRFNVNIIGAELKKVKVSGNTMVIVLQKKLSKGIHTLITRGIMDTYGNASPMRATKFVY